MRNLGFYILVLLAAAIGGVVGARTDLGSAHAVAEAAANRLRAIGALFDSGSAEGRSNIAPLKPAFPAIGAKTNESRPRRFNIDATRGRGDQNDGPMPPGLPGSALAVPTNCSLPRVDARSTLIVLGVYEGDALSMVALADRNEVTSAADVIVEPGDAPLHIILVGHDNLIWRFSGAVERVSRVVLIASPSHPPRTIALSAPTGGRHGGQMLQRPGRAVYAGTTGLPSDRVSTVAPDACTDYFYDPASIKATRFAAVVGARAGRRPDVLAGAYSLSAIKLPSAMAAVAPRGLAAPPGFEAALWSHALRFNPSGLARMEPQDVFSSVPVLPYDVLPGQMGLAQLAGQGRIERLSDGLKIVKPIPRFPAGLSGAHSVTFLLGQGVPMPSGSPGHSCVVREADGGVMGASPLCHRRW